MHQQLEVAAGMSFALFPRTFKVLNRQHWNAVDIALCDQGLPCVVNNVLKYTMRMWALLQNLRRKNPKATPKHVPFGELSDEMQEQLALPVRLERAAEQVDPTLNEDQQARLKKQARCQAKALRFLNQRFPTPRSTYIVLRNITCPVQDLLRKHSWLSSFPWELRQRADAARAAAAGIGGVTRKFRATVVAQCTYEHQCLERIRLLFNSSVMWGILDDADLDNALRAKIFCMLSAAECAIFTLIVRRSEKYPVRNFLILAQPELAEALANDPVCMLDAWTRQLRARCDPTSEEYFMDILAHALVFQTNIVPNECHNAQLRRGVKTRTQTHRQTMADLCANDISAHATEYATIDPSRGASVSCSSVDEPEEAPRKEPRKQCGGPWKQYCHEQHENHMPTVAARYAALSPAEMARLREEGEQARQRGLAGLPTYIRARDAKQHMVKVAAERALQQFNVENPGDTVEQALDTAMASGLSVPEAVQQVSAIQRASRLHDKSSLETDIVQSLDYARTHRAQAAELATSANIGTLESVLQAVPPPCEHVTLLETGGMAAQIAAAKMAAIVESLDANSQHAGVFTKSLDAYFGFMTRLVEGDLEEPHLPPDDEDEEESECFKACRRICLQRRLWEHMKGAAAPYFCKLFRISGPNSDPHVL